MNYQDKSLQSLKLGQATEYAANYDRTFVTTRASQTQS